MPLHTILRALRVLGCQFETPQPLMESMRSRYPDLWAYADVIANMICGKGGEYALLKNESVITDECIQTFQLLVSMDEEDAETMTKYLFQSKRDRKSIIEAVVGELRKGRMANPTQRYSLEVNLQNISSDRTAPEKGKLMLHNGTWYFTATDQPELRAHGYECVTEDEITNSIWVLDGWRKENPTTAAMQTEVEFGSTRVTMFFQS